mgnify:FL=1
MGKYIYTYIENGQMCDKSPSFAELLAKEGLSCEKIVTGRIEYIKVKDFETQIKDAQWLVFTSKNAVAGFAYNMGEIVCAGEPDCDGALNGDSVEAFGVRSGFPDGIKIAVVGNKTKEALRTACGFEADFVSYKSTGLELGRSLMNIAVGKIVYLCAEVTSGSLEEAMKEYENLIKIPVYRNEYVDTYAEYEMKDFVDVSGIAVTSGSSGERIKWLIDKLGESCEVPVYSIGPACSRKLVEAGVKENRIIEACEHSYSGLVEAIKKSAGKPEAGIGR